MGKGVLSGNFLGTVTICGNTFEYEGEAIIRYYDEFTDPYDVLEFLYGSSSTKEAPYFMHNFANFGGSPYAITDRWNEPFSGKGTK